ncbi:MAG TPA: ABC transporter permease, partial [Puia sp.]|nr:ABC transporter permease [Puia sp.]
MISNYLKTCFRVLARNPFFAIINFLGLTVGLVVFVILWQYSANGLQSEHFIPNHKNIARVCLKASWTDDKINWQESLCGFAQAQVPIKFSEKYAEIQGFTRMFPQKDFTKQLMGNHGKEIIISYLDEHGLKHSFIETKTVYADANLFSFFDLPMIYGNQKEVLVSPNSVVISEKEAKKYFGENNPVGQNLLLNDSLPLLVTGVFKDLPGNTHLDFELVMSMNRIMPALVDFGSARAHCYVAVKDGTDLAILAQKLNTQEKEFITRSTWGSWNFGRAELFFQKLDDAPFESYRFDYYQPKSKYIFVILRYASLLILVMAWINYINLTLSANNKRMKELAVRKATGAKSKDIAIQFLIEAIVLNLFSLVAAIAILYGSRDWIEKWFLFQVPDIENISLSMIIISGFVFLSGILLTGLYPAIISIRQSPKNIFGMFKSGKSGHWISHYLTTFQFTIALVLLIWMSTIFHQIHFVLKKDLGLDKDNVLVVDLPI